MNYWMLFELSRLTATRTAKQTKRSAKLLYVSSSPGRQHVKQQGCSRHTRPRSTENEGHPLALLTLDGQEIALRIPQSISAS